MSVEWFSLIQILLTSNICVRVLVNYAWIFEWILNSVICIWSWNDSSVQMCSNFERLLHLNGSRLKFEWILNSNVRTWIRDDFFVRILVSKLRMIFSIQIIVLNLKRSSDSNICTWNVIRVFEIRMNSSLKYLYLNSKRFLYSNSCVWTSNNLLIQILVKLWLIT